MRYFAVSTQLILSNRSHYGALTQRWVPIILGRFIERQLLARANAWQWALFSDVTGDISDSPLTGRHHERHALSLRAQRGNLLIRRAAFPSSLPFALAGRGTFLCFAKEKYPKERRPEGLVAHKHHGRLPCASRAHRRSQNSPPQTTGRLKQLLASPDVRCDARLHLRESTSTTSLPL